MAVGVTGLSRCGCAHLPRRGQVSWPWTCARGTARQVKRRPPRKSPYTPGSRQARLANVVLPCIFIPGMVFLRLEPNLLGVVVAVPVIIASIVIAIIAIRMQLRER